jgi:hypothetical protein
MSTHAIPAGLDIDRACRLLRAVLREPSGVVYGNGPEAVPTAVEFSPGLTSAEQTTLAEVLQRCQTAVYWSDADWTVFKAEYATLKTYLGITSPSNAQTAAAAKAIIRVIAAMVRVE